MKILRILASVDLRGGGPVEAVKQFHTSLARLGHETEVLSLDAPGAPCLAEWPTKTYALGPAMTSYRYTRHLVPWLKENAHNYDCVIVEGIWDYSCVAAWRALRRSGTPYFVFVHGMLDPYFKRTYPLKHLKKCLFWYTGTYYALRDAQAVVFASEEERQLARRSFRKYRLNEALAGYPTAGPGGDERLQRDAFLMRFPQLRGKRLLLFLSRIQAKKGCDLLIEAFADAAERDESLHLVMAGPDQTGWQAALQRRAGALGISERITWTGMLRDDVKWGAFHASEAFILPSHQENFGIAVTEALACSLPVLISSRINIWREIIADGAGLAANDDVAGIRRMLEEWLAMPPEERETMRRNAKHCFETRFEINQATCRLIETLKVNGPGVPV